MATECTEYPTHHHHHNQGISGKDASFLSHQQTVAENSRNAQFGAKDRADQDRYLASEFRSLQVSSAERGTSAQKDRTDDARYTAGEFGAVRKDLCDVNTNVLSVEGRLKLDIERNGRGAELAIEKTAAATVLAIEKTAAASIQQAIRDAAAAALLAMQNKMDSDAKAAACCCELKEVARAEGQKTRDLISQIDRERLQARLAVLECQAVAA